jgi:glucose-6-phosphate 1-dehydrogenase
MPATTAISSAPASATPGVLVILGASGDLTKRLLVPALHNLACDGLLPDAFAVVGMARRPLSSEEFRGQLGRDLRTFTTRREFDAEHWTWLESRIHYVAGDFGDADAYRRLAEKVREVGAAAGASGNTLLYLAISPELFEAVNGHLDAAGFTQLEGRRAIVVEKPFGKDLGSAEALNRSLLARWREEEIYRIDHYLGKETVQNLLAFRMANGIFAPLWDADHIDHIQISAAETVGVETRGEYYDKTGVVRDMLQNHLLQMLAYVCMEPPPSLDPAAVRDAKSRLLAAVRPLDRAAVERECVRGQYGPGRKADGSPAVGYRDEPKVDPRSNTETYAALTLHIDNDRWRGMPVYLRSGKALWKRGTEIVVQFKPGVGGPAAVAGEPNLLIFHIQPTQGVEIRMQAKRPGPVFRLQPAGMRFDYAETFEASRGTGYEVLLYSALNGDPTLFSRTDFVETAWRIVQPALDAWKATPAADYPSYPAGSWGPQAAHALLARDGRRWHECLTREVLARRSFFRDAPPLLLANLLLAFRPLAVAAGDVVIARGAVEDEMYFVCSGRLAVRDASERNVGILGVGDFFGEMALLYRQPRSATVQAETPCDLLVLDGGAFRRILDDFPGFEADLRRLAAGRREQTGGSSPGSSG